MNFELAKIKTFSLVNLKWHNLNYPCNPEGRPHVSFPVTTKGNIPGVEFVFTAARIGQLYLTQLLRMQSASFPLSFLLSFVVRLALPHFLTFSHKRQYFREICIEHKICILILSTPFISNIAHSKKNSNRYYHRRTEVLV